MCDTLVAVGPATADGSIILAKNSDREPNEAQALTHLPRQQHAPGTTVQCTYIQVPQVEETYEVLLSRPFWMWGGEMGANEHGVTIGNEAVFTKEPYDKDPGLTGMDMIRLTLERTTTARQAMETIIELLESHGQGGNCGFHHDLYYHNSFIIADPTEAWVLETAGQFWAAERVRNVRTLSNGLTIGREWDLASPGLVEHAIEKGWCSSADEFHFARCYSDRLYTRLNGCRTRQCRSTELLKNQQGCITPATMMAALRDHGPQGNNDPTWNPGRGWLMETLCVHASFGPTRTTQSVGGMVAHLSPHQSTYWLTGTSGTCTSIFKPIYLGPKAGLPDRSILGPDPAGVCDATSLWWTHERLHRAVIRDYATRMPLYRAERDALEAAFLHEALEQAEPTGKNPPPSPAAFTTSCFRQAAEATARWTEMVLSTPVQHRPPLLFSLAWNQYDHQAGCNPSTEE